MEQEALGVEPPPPVSHNTVHHAVATSGETRRLSDVAARWAVANGVDRGTAEDIRLAVYEAVANIVVHAYSPGGQGPVTVTTRVEPGHLVVAVADAGTWRERPGTGHDGRGLGIIKAVAQRTDVATSENGTIVVMTWPKPPPKTG